MSVSDARLAQLAARFAELEARLASGTLEGPEFVAASRDYAELEPVARVAAEVSAMRGELASLSELGETDPEMRALAEEEVARLKDELPPDGDVEGMLAQCSEAQDEFIQRYFSWLVPSTSSSKLNSATGLNFWP